VAYESQKSRKQVLEKTLLQLKSQTEQQLSSLSPAPAVAKDTTNLSLQLGSLEQKNQQLQNELNKLQRILEQEFGEFASIDKLEKDEQGWKRRQQQIELLKQKLSQENNQPQDVRGDLKVKQIAEKKQEEKQAKLDSFAAMVRLIRLYLLAATFYLEGGGRETQSQHQEGPREAQSG